MKSKTVEELAQDITVREGGFVNHPNDHGGPTNHGCSLAFARSVPKVNGRFPFDLNGDGKVDIDDIKLITQPFAKQAFIDHFFKGCRVDELPACIQPMQFDMNVNGGPGGGAKVLQLALVNLGCHVAIDGDLGPQTIAAAKAVCARVGDAAFCKAYIEARVAHYQAIVRRDPSQKVFLAGWENRARSFA